MSYFDDAFLSSVVTVEDKAIEIHVIRSTFDGFSSDSVKNIVNIFC